MQTRWESTCRVWVLLALLGIAGCASSPEPFEYHDERDQKSGPGLFSGEEGGFVIYDGPGNEKKEKKNKETDSKDPISQ